MFQIYFGIQKMISLKVNRFYQQQEILRDHSGSNNIPLKIRVERLVIIMCLDKFQGIPTPTSTWTRNFIKFR